MSKPPNISEQVSTQSLYLFYKNSFSVSISSCFCFSRLNPVLHFIQGLLETQNFHYIVSFTEFVFFQNSSIETLSRLLCFSQQNSKKSCGSVSWASVMLAVSQLTLVQTCLCSKLWVTWRYAGTQIPFSGIPLLPPYASTAC